MRKDDFSVKGLKAHLGKKSVTSDGFVHKGKIDGGQIQCRRLVL